MAEKKITTLCAVGDVVAFYSNPESAFEHVGEILRGADITFAQNERHYSGKRTREDMSTQVGFTEMNTPQNAEALKLGGFDVISFASNHSMDIGPETMLETVHVLKNLGFAVIGAGKNIAEARKLSKSTDGWTAPTTMPALPESEPTPLTVPRRTGMT